MSPSEDPSIVASAVRVSGLRKLYGTTVAIDGIDLDILEGEIFALLGRNGAGKTTTVEILEGYRARSSGSVEVLGVDPESGNGSWKARVGIVLQGSGAFDELTVREAVHHIAHLYPDPLDPDVLITRVGLGDEQDRRGAQLSIGQQRRLDLALGVVGNPELLFLDEPTTGFDPEAREDAWELIEELRTGGTTIVLTTHLMEEADRLADRVAVIDQGRILDVSRPRDLAGRSARDAVVSFRLVGPLCDLRLPSVADGQQAVDGERVVVRTARPTAVIQALATWAGSAGVTELPELAVSRASLQDAYLSLLRGDEGK